MEKTEGLRKAAPGDPRGPRPARAPGRRARRAWTHRAAAPIPAGAGATLVNLGLASGPRVPRPARAGVAALARVGAGGPVLTGLVVCAVVEVWEGWGQEEAGSPGLDSGRPHLPCEKPEPRSPRGDRRLTLVAEEAPPAFLTGALPRLLAGAVETAWVPDALVTVPALPADSAPERGGQ